jgi:NSS family neurotransmitter:Na+ symporter
VLISLIVVWVAIIVVMALGVQKGIAASSIIFIPLLVVMFVILVVRSLFLPGAIDGLDAFFKPHWGALLDPRVWIAAYGQIFFSLSVAFGIMLTYASYLKKKTDLTGSGLVVGFANSGFEILCGIGVFSALGFMAQAQGVAIDEVVASGIGLAFIAFPTIISEAPAGALIGVLFFGSLVLAGFTSLVSIVEVVIAALQDKFGLARIPSTLWVCIPIAVVSTVLFSTTMGLPLLDVMDKWANEYGIVAAALVSSLVVAYVIRGLPTLKDHLNFRGSVPIGAWWYACVALIAPLVLGVSLVISTFQLLTSEGTYEDYPGWFVGVFGWLMAIGLVVIAIVLSLIPWPTGSNLHKNDSDGDPIAPEVVAGRGLVPQPEASTPHELRSTRT